MVKRQVIATTTNGRVHCLVGSNDVMSTIEGYGDKCGSTVKQTDVFREHYQHRDFVFAMHRLAG